MTSHLPEERAERPAAAAIESPMVGDGHDLPFTDEALGVVRGGYIGETEKNLPPRF